MTKTDMTNMLNSFEVNAQEKHQKRVQQVAKTKKQSSKNTTDRATALISMTAEEKERITTISRSHGLNLSSFMRLAADEYIRSHNW